MIVILCLDDRNGMMFNNRRQSRDQAVIEDMVLASGKSLLYMKEYSYKLFSGLELDNVIISLECLQQAKEGEFCFVEDENILPYYDRIEQLIIYRWNRKYPADFYFDIALDKDWELAQVKEFVGTSHDKIKKEIYLKCTNHLGYSS